jgi:hypothetical protein
MALLKEDNSFTHVIAIDFGTGASGYFLCYQDMLLHLEILIKMAKFVSKFLVHAMAMMIKKLLLLFYSQMKESSLILERMHCKNMHKLFRMAQLLYFFKMYKCL